ncbi:1-(5-phosphoribosyl)-5-((5-phosphoribosylamino)methylideneamino)imidazole-4-carboxamide isomerase [Thiocapsa imhoffii]|uniref:1-(5-phosphoribosyl)-5-((5-phosphoribosylamino)methylideneamino)imidazole-4-carboxamide isomerase n=1 Tax=Thiocapsa imhoffii TaxID=382777 RepID=A0A9X0WHK4_9GAMM|nr:DUF971 domain-containing protein [Thiocapsa imhoffii]MBK1644683.1 1-(5-phosphoribosyl)-5-((5-phosphoribosylamino)methylideneamino)imidazole-4-carboxamide isomerase [Thiocapsa imhoffii]
MEHRSLPTEIALHQQSRVLEIAFDDGARFRLPCEYLRVYSPSAEVRGHSPDTAKLQVKKEAVNITDLQQIGHYAVKIIFDDGHKSGLYDWNYLYKLGRAWQPLWFDYLQKIKDVGYQRSAPDPFETLAARGEQPAQLPGDGSTGSAVPSTNQNAVSASTEGGQ